MSATAYTLEVDDAGPDRNGERSYSLTWTGYRHDRDAVGPRAQHFHADLHRNLVRLMRDGATFTPRADDALASAAIIRAHEEVSA